MFATLAVHEVLHKLLNPACTLIWSKSRGRVATWLNRVNVKMEARLFGKNYSTCVVPLCVGVARAGVEAQLYW